MEIPKTVRELKDTLVDGEIKTGAQLLQKPGDFAYSKVAAVSGKIIDSVVMRCPKCNNPLSFPYKHGYGPLRKVVIAFYRLLNRKGELLTIEPGCFCTYCDFKFKVFHGEIQLIEEQSV